MIVEAYIRGDPDVQISGDQVVASIEGFMDPVSIPLSTVKRATAERDHSSCHRQLGPAPDEREPVARASGHDQAPRPSTAGAHSTIAMEQTVVSSLWTVRALHCNSKAVLFGGTLMRWIEETSAIAARQVYPGGAWSSASIDALTFKSSAQPGEVVYVRAVSYTLLSRERKALKGQRSDPRVG